MCHTSCTALPHPEWSHQSGFNRQGLKTGAVAVTRNLVDNINLLIPIAHAERLQILRRWELVRNLLNRTGSP